MALLEQESQLIEIVRLVGAESISAADRLALKPPRSIREISPSECLHKVDTYTQIEKQHDLLMLILRFHRQALAAIEHGSRYGRPVCPAGSRISPVPNILTMPKPTKFAASPTLIDRQIRELYSAIQLKRFGRPGC